MDNSFYQLDSNSFDVGLTLFNDSFSYVEPIKPLTGTYDSATRGYVLPPLTIVLNAVADGNDGRDKPGETPTPAVKEFNPEEIEKLVQKLGDPVYRKRESAQRQLVEKLYGTGSAGVSLLNKLFRSEPDPEIRMRLNEVTKQLVKHPDLWRVHCESMICWRVDNLVGNLPDRDKQVYKDFAQSLMKGDTAKLAQLISAHPEALNKGSLIFRDIARIMEEELGMIVTIAESAPENAQDPSVREFSKELRIDFMNQAGRICIQPAVDGKPSVVGYDIRGKFVDNVNPRELFETTMTERFESRRKGQSIPRRSDSLPDFKIPPRQAGALL